MPSLAAPVSRRGLLTAAALGLAGLAGAGVLSACGRTADGSEASLVNVSYDPTREFYEQYNELFARRWRDEAAQGLTVTMSHGGSGKQALAVTQGLPADVVTLALEADVDEIARAGLIASDWIGRLPRDSAPYTSTIVFLVRRGNPKGIRDWDDVARDGVGVITPNPKTSGGARWNYLAAWAWASRRYGGNEDRCRELIRKIYANVLVLDSGARGATTSFVENGQGDVLLAWENEAHLSLAEHKGEFEIVVPSVSVLCQPSVAVVDEVARRHGTEKLARAYLEHLYADDAQRLAGKNFYRPSTPAVLAEFSGTFPELELATIAELGGWKRVQEKHFADGGVFDQIYER